MRQYRGNYRGNRENSAVIPGLRSSVTTNYDTVILPERGNDRCGNAAVAAMKQSPYLSTVYYSRFTQYDKERGIS